MSRVSGDRYAGEWPRERFRQAGIQYELADRSKSELFRDLLPALNSGLIELLDDPRLHGRLAGLERRTGRSGRDAIDHGPGGHDDLANSVAGALLAAQRGGLDGPRSRLIGEFSEFEVQFSDYQSAIAAHVERERRILRETASGPAETADPFDPPAPC